MAWQPAETVTVSGEAKSNLKNQIASFSAGVNVTKDNKDEAVKEVNGKVEAIIKAVKEFGITEGDCGHLWVADNTVIDDYCY